jgi:hypothetical protein
LEEEKVLEVEKVLEREKARAGIGTCRMDLI